MKPLYFLLICLAVILIVQANPVVQSDFPTNYNGSGITNLNTAALSGTVPAANLPAQLSGVFEGTLPSVAVPSGYNQYDTTGSNPRTSYSENVCRPIRQTGYLSNFWFQAFINSASLLASTNLVLCISTNAVNGGTVGVIPICTITGANNSGTLQVSNIISGFPVFAGESISVVITNTGANAAPASSYYHWGFNLYK